MPGSLLSQPCTSDTQHTRTHRTRTRYTRGGRRRQCTVARRPAKGGQGNPEGPRREELCPRLRRRCRAPRAPGMRCSRSGKTSQRPSRPSWTGKRTRRRTGAPGKMPSPPCRAPPLLGAEPRSPPPAALPCPRHRLPPARVVGVRGPPGERRHRQSRGPAKLLHRQVPAARLLHRQGRRNACVETFELPSAVETKVHEPRHRPYLLLTLAHAGPETGMRAGREG